MRAGLPRLTFVLGGSRSGKSRFAQGLMPTEAPVIYWATGLPVDAEMKKRIAIHRQSRPKHWGLLEEPCDLLQGLKKLRAAGAKLVLLDSLTAWVANVSSPDSLPETLSSPLSELRRFLEALKNARLHCVIVSDEVGMGIVPETAIGRKFRDVLGDANQIVAAASDRVYCVIAGIPRKIK